MYNPRNLINRETSEESPKNFFRTVRVQASDYTTPKMPLEKKCKNIIVRRKIMMEHSPSIDDVKKLRESMSMGSEGATSPTFGMLPLPIP
jgi:hypothetical protein